MASNFLTFWQWCYNYKCTTTTTATIIFHYYEGRSINKFQNGAIPTFLLPFTVVTHK